MSENVLIPRSTLEGIISMMECIDFVRLPNHLDYLHILRELKVKVQKLELRDAYSKLVRADSTDSAQDARIEYLWQKSQVGKVDV